MESSCLAPPVIFNFLLNNDVRHECDVFLNSVEVIPYLGIATYLSIFFWTCALESPFYFFALRRIGKSWTQSSVVLILANLATHPIVTFVLPRIANRLELQNVYGILIEETFAPVIETLALRKLTQLTLAQSALISFSANLFSFWVGTLIPQNWFI